MSVKNKVLDLERENFALAANQCREGYCDEYGNHRCKFEDEWNNVYQELVELRREYAKLEASHSDLRNRIFILSKT